MAHIWQGFRSGLRSGEWLTAARARAYSLILLGICGPSCCDRDGSRLSDGADRSQRQAARHRFFQRLCGRGTDLAGPLRRTPMSRRSSTRRRRPCSAAARCRSIGWHYPPFFFAIAIRGRRLSLCMGSCDLAGRIELRRLSRRRSAQSCRAPRTLLLAAAFPGSVRQHRPRPDRTGCSPGLGRSLPDDWRFRLAGMAEGWLCRRRAAARDLSCAIGAECRLVADLLRAAPSGPGVH